MKKLLFVAALAVLAFAAVAQSRAATIENVPIFSPLRASVAVGGDYAFYGGKDAPEFPVKKEWQSGIFVGYKLTPPGLSLIFATRYGVDSKQFDTKVGLRLLLWSGTGGGVVQ